MNVRVKQKKRNTMTEEDTEKKGRGKDEQNESKCLLTEKFAEDHQVVCF